MTVSRPPTDARNSQKQQAEEEEPPHHDNHDQNAETTTTTTLSTAASSQKSHTFRQRRLSLSNLQSLMEEATADQNDNTQNATSEPAMSTEKTYSFRKRRLSLTQQQQQQDATEGSASSPEGPRRSKRRRRSSDSSTNASTTTGQPSSPQCPAPPPPPPSSRIVLTPKTVHAEELIGPHHPPPSPAVSVNNILYQQVLLPAPPSLLLLPPPVVPVDTTTTATTTTTTTASTALVAMDPERTTTNNTSNGSGTNNNKNQHHQHQQHYSSHPSSHPYQPLWKRRYTVREEHKLPFPRHVVGTYSCHGMEPIYDTPEEEEEGGGEEEDDTEDHDDENGGRGFIAVQDATPTHPNGAIRSQQQEEQEDENGNSVPPFQPRTESSGLLPPPSNESKGKEKEGDHENTSNQPKEIVTDQQGPAKSAMENNNEEQEEAEYEEEEEELPKTMAKINQDRGGIVYPYANCPQTALFAVYDGHGMGGELVSQFALTEIQRRLEKHPCYRTDLPTAMKETFLKVDEALKDEPLIEPLYAGTTACVALLQGTNLTLANVGDSRAVMARRSHYTNKNKSHQHTIQSASSWQAIPLTEDQNPDLPQEAERIIQAGGFVSASPAPGLSARVWLDPDCTTIGLAMSRSIGDHAVAEIGVIAEPVVTEYVVDDLDDFMILASDGVWEFLSSAEAVEIVGQNLHRGATKACQALIEAAAAKWHEEEGEYRDDITAIVVRMQELWKSPAATAAAAAATEATADAAHVETADTTTISDKV